MEDVNNSSMQSSVDTFVVHDKINLNALKPTKSIYSHKVFNDIKHAEAWLI